MGVKREILVYLSTEFFHVIKDCIDVRHYVNAIYKNWPIASVSQGGMQNCSVFGEVDFLSAEHGIARFLYLTGFGLKSVKF